METQRDIESVKDNPDTNENESLPIDRGWAWIVLAGAAFYLAIFGGIKKNFGIIFVAIQDRFGSTASVTSLLTTMQNLVMSFSSLFIITTVGTEFLSSRMSITLGALVFTTSHIISAFSTGIHMLFASVGFLEGLGTAISYPSVIATIGEYFDKRRGLATGLAFCGSNVGWFILAPILSALFEDIGYSGTFMIIAGVTLNILVTAALLRPVKSFKRHKLITKKKTTEETTKDIKDGGDILESENLLPVKDNVILSSTNSIENGVQSERNKTDEILTQLVLEKENKGKMKVSADGTRSTSEIICFDLCDQQSHTKSSSPLLPRNTACSLGNRRTSISSQNSQKGLSPLNSLAVSLSRSQLALCSSVDIICGPVIDTPDIPAENIQENKNKDKKASFRRRLNASYDLTLFRSVVFPVFLLMAAMMAPTTLLLPVFLAPLSRDLGLSAERTGLLMSIIGGVGMFSRILCALFADRKYVKLTTLLAVVSTLAGVTTHCVRFIKTFPLL
ncbi:monocarboxylate transporter 7-like [Mercenaria mercenaria]|uniref:monocarboxylate transporter 7-like n=1 Tax=Mercenaria mercenaria TaxID=6596 RepID=UPI00234F2FE9|nr:monocarboxylate transporter 7-like [Mercenaria mercenaria]XP_053403484.1 monocarboxylate transporter 7-like [Mercenaria mercenaria]XP_053403485.1 monocarboxylate transporter 7-like [Mercenaria mercenaria]